MKCHQDECVAVHGVPTHFLGLLDELAKHPNDANALKAIGKLRWVFFVRFGYYVRSIAELNVSRTGIAAGSPIPIELMRQLIDKLGLVDLSIAYGMSASPTNTVPFPVSMVWPT
jgi:acyl-CoA synthetase (AMP-forming)/AMP-acid ligase II